MGVWIEIKFEFEDEIESCMSLPSWECGLKYFWSIWRALQMMSLPSWECGLKWERSTAPTDLPWSLPSWECGLKFLFRLYWLWVYSVAPFVGVWIEITTHIKLRYIPTYVAPFVGVWIEIIVTCSQRGACRGRSLRGSVD